jgi:hypothetical protein
VRIVVGTEETDDILTVSRPDDDLGDWSRVWQLLLVKLNEQAGVCEVGHDDRVRPIVPCQMEDGPFELSDNRRHRADFQWLE